MVVHITRLPIGQVVDLRRNTILVRILSGLAKEEHSR